MNHLFTLVDNILKKMKIYRFLFINSVGLQISISSRNRTVRGLLILLTNSTQMKLQIGTQMNPTQLH